MPFLFYLFSAITLCSALAVAFSKKPVSAVLSLVFAFVGAAGVWMLLEAEFLSLILVVVYVGAVMVLFLFVVMMIHVQARSLKVWVSHWPFVLGVVGVICAVMVLAVFQSDLPFLFSPFQEQPHTVGNTQLLGDSLYADFTVPFELAGVLLLSAMVAAIALTHRAGRPGSRQQKTSDQMNANPKTRLRIVKMDAQAQKK